MPTGQDRARTQGPLSQEARDCDHPNIRAPINARLWQIGRDKRYKQGSGINANKQAVNANKREITHRVQTCSGSGHLFANLCSLPRSQPHLSWPNQAPCEFVHLTIYFEKVSPKISFRHEIEKKISQLMAPPPPPPAP